MKNALEYMKKQVEKQAQNLERELLRKAPDEVIGNIVNKLSHYVLAVEALKIVGERNG